MEKTNKVKVVSCVNYSVGLIIPEHHFARNFDREGSFAWVDKDVLEEGMNSIGVQTLFKEGMLKIEEAVAPIKGDETPEEIEEANKEIVEELNDALYEGEPEPVILNNGQIIRLLKLGTLAELEKTLNEAAAETKQKIIDVAVKEKFTDYEKCALIKKYLGQDILRMVQLSEDLK